MQVRVWRIGESQDLVASMKGHKAAVTGLRLTRGDAEVASAGADGCCIIWDLHTFVRRTSLVGQLFASVAYHPDESQLVTVGARNNGPPVPLAFLLGQRWLGRALSARDRQVTNTYQHAHAGFLSQNKLAKPPYLGNLLQPPAGGSLPSPGHELGPQAGSSCHTRTRWTARPSARRGVYTLTRV